MRTWMTISTRLCTAAAAASLLTACGGSPASQGGDGGPSAGGPDGPGSSAAPGPTGARCSVTQRGLPISEGKGSDPAIAADNARYGVAWTSLVNDGGDVVFALVDPEGKKVKETPVDVGNGVADQPSVVRTKSGYLVLWAAVHAATSTIRGLYLGEDGAPAGGAFTVAESHSTEARPSGAGHGEDVVVAYQDGTGSIVGLLHGTSLQSPQPIAKAADPVVAAEGSNFGLVYLAETKIAFSRLQIPLQAPAPVLFRDAAGKANLPRIAARPDGAFDAVWEDDRAGAGAETVYFTRIGADGKPKGEIQIPPVEGSANVPDIAAFGAFSAVVYYQFRDGPPAVFLSLISADLAREDLDLELSGKGGRYPRLAASGSSLGVVYAEKDGPVRMSLASCR